MAIFRSGVEEGNDGWSKEDNEYANAFLAPTPTRTRSSHLCLPLRNSLREDKT
ncbi:MAG: hypothetical protein AAF733_07845 [Verrucomicrobiota bacterium]